ncbi:hypothetical protein B9T62_06700 [Paenibacillus donghaensis]|uniref:Uncharacterized protein n=1 Tax=Paenibacillus donghaensis TaxID=414771 RepID=A0A2Z2KEN8_9BACL|nr:hypothetical protein B9T62_06700 [Paenibacillus donghaensis]
MDAISGNIKGFLKKSSLKETRGLVFRTSIDKMDENNKEGIATYILKFYEILESKISDMLRGK